MLDEPSLGLAPAIVETLYQTLERLHREGLTLLLAEQSVPMALEVADYAYVLQTGRTVLEGPADALRRDPQVQRISLGFGDERAADSGPRRSGSIGAGQPSGRQRRRGLRPRGEASARRSASFCQFGRRMPFECRIMPQ
jgi:ABC-type multidrug transport system ATPase subunit